MTPRRRHAASASAKASTTSARTRPGSPSRQKPSTARGEATRARIVAAARKVAVEHGPLGLTLRAVASEAEVVLSNLQFHFASQDELLRAVLDAELDAGTVFVARAVMACPSDPVGAAIDALLALQHQRGAARLFFSLWAVATTSRPLRTALHAFYSDWIARMSAVARPDAREKAWLFVSLVEGASLFRCGVTGSVDAAQEEVLRRHLRALLGYAPPAGSAQD